jgi:hypothetical protein
MKPDSCPLLLYGFILLNIIQGCLTVQPYSSRGQLSGCLHTLRHRDLLMIQYHKAQILNRSFLYFPRFLVRNNQLFQLCREMKGVSEI